MAKKVTQKEKNKFLQKNIEVQPTKFGDYKMGTDYILGDLIEHPKFGRGYIEEVLPGDKISVWFETGNKVLIHNR